MKLSRSEQARINGAKSKGPITPEGKATSSQNAIKHGLTGGLNIVLMNENNEEYQLIRARWFDQLHPETDAERGLVDRIAAAEWRLERYVAMQSTLMDYEIDTRCKAIHDNWSTIDEPGLLAVAFRDAARESNGFDLLRRYEAMLDRSIARNIKLLHDLQDRRKAAALAEAQDQAPPKAVAAPKPVTPLLVVRNEPESAGFTSEINAATPPIALPPAA